MDGFYKILFDINEETNDFNLENDEYIRIVAIKADNKNIIITKYFKHKSEIEEFVNKNKYVFNIYIGLATTKGKCGTAKHMYKRRVLMLDFDKKDYPLYNSVEDFSKHIKGRIKILFTHMTVDSGNGFHYYIAIKQLKNNKRVSDVNRALAKMLEADTKAALPTQIARLPTSLNLKDKENPKLVNIVSNNLESSPDKFKPYNILKIESFIENYNKNLELLNKAPQTPSQEYVKCSSYFCVESMISEGVKKGERNFALGRITKYLKDIRGYNEHNALEIVQDWNLRCDPPKLPSIIESDFKRYWDGDYKLLGCIVPNPKDRETIQRFCDKTKCNAIFENTKYDKVEGVELSFDNNILKNTYLRDMSGYHYMILSILDFHKKPMKRNEIVKSLTGRKTKTCTVSDNTLRKVLNDLIKKKMIAYDETCRQYSLQKIPNYGAGYTRYYYSATLLLVNRVITPTEYLVYLCLVRNLQMNYNVIYDTLADNLNMDKSNISRAIQGLHEAGCLTVDKGYNEKGKIYNVYKIVA